MKKAYSAPTQSLSQFSNNEHLSSGVGGLSPPESRISGNEGDPTSRKTSNSLHKGSPSRWFNSPFVSFFMFPS